MQKVSVIVPVYNGEKYVEKCIERLLAEKELLHEIIFVNDGSTDNTKALLAKYSSLEKVCVISQENKGVSAARNTGLDACSGDWIAFCDVDDEIRDGYFADISKEITNRIDTDFICYARARVGSDDNDKNEDCFDKNEAFQMVLEQSNYRYEADYLLMMVWSKVFRKTFLCENGIRFDEKINFAEDALFMMECVIRSRRIDLIHRGFYVYLPNDEGICKKGGGIKDLDTYLQFESRICKMKDENNVFFSNAGVLQALKVHMLHYGNNMIGRVARGTKKMPFHERKKVIKIICINIRKYIEVATLKERLIFLLKDKLTGIYIFWQGRDKKYS